MTPNNPVRVVCYHQNCFDGFAAAWAMWSVYGEEDTIYVPVTYNRPIDVESLRDRLVYFVDFCPTLDEVKQIRQVAYGLYIYDHHKTRKAVFDEGLGALFYGRYDEGRSGAAITWQETCGKDSPMPVLVRYVEDRDLWRFNLPGTRAINNVLGTLAWNFADWNDVADKLESPIERERLVEIGEYIERYRRGIIRSNLKAAFTSNLAGYTVPFCQTLPQFASDVGNELALQVPFSVCFYDNGFGRQFSLRSVRENPHHVDVAAVAEQFGGGGHRNAAGFSVKPGHPLMMLHAIDDGK